MIYTVHHSIYFVQCYVYNTNTTNKNYLNLRMSLLSTKYSIKNVNKNNLSSLLFIEGEISDISQ